VNGKVRGALAAAGAVAFAAGLAASAEPVSNEATPSETPPPTLAPPPESSATPPQPPPTVIPPSNSAQAQTEPAANAAPAKQAAAKPPAPPPPPAGPVRSPTAVLQALDKVTAETMRFAAPVGQPVRYKNLVFTVKACETSGFNLPSPQSSAYVVIDLAPPGAEGVAPPPPKQVFKGWMFSNSPALNPFQHPVYDAWLIACMAATPPA
jgi:hypothetical protein